MVWTKEQGNENGEPERRAGPDECTRLYLDMRLRKSSQVFANRELEYSISLVVKEHITKEKKRRLEQGIMM